jgi:hypothetical protein
MVQNQEHGVILSPRYPDIVIVSCSWRIAVPRDHFAVITVHDLERQSITVTVVYKLEPDKIVRIIPFRQDLYVN